MLEIQIELRIYSYNVDMKSVNREVVNYFRIINVYINKKTFTCLWILVGIVIYKTKYP